MKKILLSLCLCFSLLAYSQLTTTVKQSFPAHILYRIDGVASKILLTEEQQLKIGKRLSRKDSLANVYIRRTDTVIELKKFYSENIYVGMLKPILTQEQLDDYLFQIEKNNRFLLAIKSAKELELNSKQVEQIQIQNNFLNKKTEFSNNDKNAFYNRKLDSILEKKQYNVLLKLIYTKESALKTQKDWKEMLRLHLVTPNDSAKVYSKINNYNLIKNIMLDPKAGITGPKKKTALLHKANLQFQPPIVTRYYILTDDFYKPNRFSEIIKYEKQLKLTNIQIDTLLYNYKKLEQLKFNDLTQNTTPDKSKGYVTVENKAILKILDTKQLRQFLILSNQKKAVALANNSWQTLEKLGLTKDLKKEDTLKEFASYELKSLVAESLVKIDNNQINVFHRRDVLNNKPALLEQLDQINQKNQNAKTTKNNLKW